MESKHLEKPKVSRNERVNLKNDNCRQFLGPSSSKTSTVDPQVNGAISTNSIVMKIDDQSSTKNSKTHSRRKNQLPRVFTSMSDGVRKTARFLGKNNRVNNKRSKDSYQADSEILLHRPADEENLPTKLSNPQHDSMSLEVRSRTHSVSSMPNFLQSFSNLSQGSKNEIHKNEKVNNAFIYEETVVHMLELFLRRFLIYGVTYFFGVYTSSNDTITKLVYYAIEFGAVAWATCLLILFLTFYHKVRGSNIISEEHGKNIDYVENENEKIKNFEESSMLLHGNSIHDYDYRSISVNEKKPDSDEFVPLTSVARMNSHDSAFILKQSSISSLIESKNIIESTTSPTSQKIGKINDDRKIIQSKVVKAKKSPTKLEMDFQKELNDLYVINSSSMARLTPNSIDHIMDIDNDLYHGKVLLLIKTTNNFNDPFGSYFDAKQRRFEMRLQIKFKKVPEHPIYLACELDKPMKLGVVQRAFIRATLNFVKKMNSGLHYNLNGTDGISEIDIKEGNFESATIAFTLNSMDRIIETKLGEVVPDITKELFECPEAMKMRKRKIHFDFNTESTYTMAFWSAYTDFLQWKAMNLPAIKPFSLSSVFGKQAFRVVIYCLKPSEKGLHLHNCKNILEEYEFSHLKISSLGRLALEWEKQNKTVKSDMLSIPQNKDKTKLTTHPSHEQNDSLHSLSKLGLDLEENVGQSIEDNDDNDNNDIDLVEGIYLKSGDPIFLRDADSRNNSSYLTLGRGYAILQRHTSTIIQIEKADVTNSKNAFKSKKKFSNKDMSKLIQSGDVVNVKLILNGNGEDSRNVRYLTTQKRKWLKWVSTIPRNNGYFQIIKNETEVFQQNDLIQNDISTESQSIYIRLGGSFFLKHCRWPSFVVGVNIKTSARFGGQVLALTTNHIIPAPECSDEDDDDTSQDSQQIKDKKYLVRPLQFRAELSNSRLPLSSISSNYNSPIHHQASSFFFEQEKSNLLKSKEEWNNDFLLDVPAWIEMTHRTNRTIQRVYVLRIDFNRKLVSSNSFVQNNEQEENLKSKINFSRSNSLASMGEKEKGGDLNLFNVITPSKSKSFVRLRTGKDLSIILQMGMSKSVTVNCETKGKISNEKQEPNSILVQTREGNDDLSTELSIYHDQNSCLSDDSDESSKEPDLNSTSTISNSYDGNEEQKDLKHQIMNSNQSNKPIDTSVANASYLNSTIPTIKIPLNQLEQAMSGGTPHLYKPIDPLGRKSSQLEETHNVSVYNLDDNEYDIDGETDEQDDFGVNGTLAGPRKKKWISKPAGSIVKVAKNVKTGTVITKNQVVKQGKKVGKGTVNAGRAITKRIHTSAGASNEPKLSKVKDKNTVRKSGRDHHVAVNKTLKNMEKKFLTSCSSSRILAGELSAPDQSCRTVSKVLSEISINNTTSCTKLDGKVLLESEVTFESELDAWFLRGGPAELGITPNESHQTIREAIVASCLWESHWREEWFGLYENHLCLYAPLTKKPSLTIFYVDIQDIRLLEKQGVDSPLPAFPILAIDTAWRCYYFAFINEEVRETCVKSLFSAIFDNETQAPKENNDAWKAHLLQAFQTSVDTDRSNCGGKWARVSSSSKSSQRIVLNIRKMAFDLEPFPSDNGYQDERAIGLFVEKLLAKSLSFSIDSFETSAVEFVEFLDDTSRLKLLPLQNLDYAGKEAFCIFVNLYHCLLQHSLLLSIDGPLTKRSFGQFMKTSCYEIGGDVFSLAEIECCVIRGALSLPINPKSPFVEISKKRIGYRAYELQNVDPRVNFILHSGDTSKGSRIPILSPDTLEETMVKYTTSFFRRNIAVDSLKRTLTLPKVIEVYRNDFGGGEPHLIVPYCLQYVDEETQCIIMKYINNESMNYSIKYQSSCDQFYSSLKMGD